MHADIGTEWMKPIVFQVMFARPMPGVANILNAFVTKATCEWLMGKCTVNDVELPTGEVRVMMTMPDSRSHMRLTTRAL